MKSRFLLWVGGLVCLLLAGCIPVDDASPYWKKGLLDPALEGYWQEVKTDGADSGENTLISIYKEINHYIIEITQIPPEGEPPLPAFKVKARSFYINNYRFLVIPNLKEAQTAYTTELMRQSPDIDGLDQEELSPETEALQTDARQEDSIAQMKDELSNAYFPTILLHYSINRGHIKIYTLDPNILIEAIDSGEVAGYLPAADTDDESAGQNTPKENRFALKQLDQTTLQFLVILASNKNNWSGVYEYEPATQSPNPH